MFCQCIALFLIVFPCDVLQHDIAKPKHVYKHFIPDALCSFSIHLASFFALWYLRTDLSDWNSLITQPLDWGCC